MVPLTRSRRNEVRELIAQRRRQLLELLGVNDTSQFIRETNAYPSRKLSSLMLSTFRLAGKFKSIDIPIALLVHDLTFRAWMERGRAYVLDPTCGENHLFRRSREALKEFGIELIQCDVNPKNACGETCDVFDVQSMARAVEKTGRSSVDAIVYDPPYIEANLSDRERRRFYYADSAEDIGRYFSGAVLKNFYELLDDEGFLLVKTMPYWRWGEERYVHPFLEFPEFFKNDLFEVTDVVHVDFATNRLRNLILVGTRVISRAVMQRKRYTLSTTTYLVVMKKL